MKKLIIAMMMIAMMMIAVVVVADNEITLSGNLTATKNFSNVKEQPSGLQIDWTGDKSWQYTLATSTNPVALPATGFTSNGLCFMRNQSTNYPVNIGLRGSTTVADLQLLPGEYAFMRLHTGVLITNIYAWTYNPVVVTNAVPATNANFYIRILEN